MVNSLQPDTRENPSCSNSTTNQGEEARDLSQIIEKGFSDMLEDGDDVPSSRKKRFQKLLDKRNKLRGDHERAVWAFDEAEKLCYYHQGFIAGIAYARKEAAHE